MSESIFETQQEIKKSKESDLRLSDTLFQIFTDLNQGQREPNSGPLMELLNVYSGNDESLKKTLLNFFSAEVNIYDSFELNSSIKALAAKMLQAIINKDKLVTFDPGNYDLDAVERTEVLINNQLKSEDYISELYKQIKDGLVYGRGFMSIGWKTETQIIPKRTRTIVRSVDASGKEIEDEIITEEEEQVIVEKPDFKTELVSNILYPRADRWEDIPHCIRLEYISKSEFNSRYSSLIKEELCEFDRTNASSSNYDLQLDYRMKTIPASNNQYESGGLDEVRLAHFHFSNGTYVVTQLDYTQHELTEGKQQSQYHNLKVLYKGPSPIPGLPIPITCFTPEPFTGRVEGESLVKVGLTEQRKLAEMDNLTMQAYRNQAFSPIFVGKGARLDYKKWENRKPNQMMEVDDINEVKSFDLKPFDGVSIQLRGLFKQSLDSALGVNDFFVGNIGRSSRLSGVDSLLSNALSRLTPGLVQIRKIILQTAEMLILVNRKCLPKTFVQLETSLNVKEPIESFSIPYPLQASIYTPVDGGSSRDQKVAGLMTTINIAQQQEQVDPGSWDIKGLLAYTFKTLGVPEVKRFMLKTPMTNSEADMLRQVDSALRLYQNSILPNSENALGIPQEQAQMQNNASPSTAAGMSQSMQPPSLSEVTNQSL